MRLKTGDIFSFELSDGSQAFGQVILMPSKQCFGKTQPPLHPESYLHFFSNTFFVNLFRHRSADGVVPASFDVLVKGLVVDKAAATDKLWRRVDCKREVRVQELDFPECLCSGYAGNYFCKGELALRVPYPESELTARGPLPTIVNSYSTASVYCFYAGLTGLLDDRGIILGNLSNVDLRYDTQKRQAVIKDISIDINLPYYQLALNAGYDLKRFY